MLHVKFFEFYPFVMLCILLSIAAKPSPIPNLLIGPDMVDNILNGADQALTNYFNKDSTDHVDAQEQMKYHKQSMKNFMKDTLLNEYIDPIEYFESVMQLNDTVEHAKIKIKNKKEQSKATEKFKAVHAGLNRGDEDEKEEKEKEEAQILGVLGGLNDVDDDGNVGKFYQVFRRKN